MSKRLPLHMLWIATALTILLPSLADPDLWGHVLFGHTLLRGAMRATNFFSYTTADHVWLNHELFAEMMMAAAFDAFGPGGLVALKTMLGLATLALVWRSAFRRSDNAVASTIATVVAAWIMAPGFMIRPQLFTFVFLAAILDLLGSTRYRARGVAWLVPAIAVLWANTHGGVLAGLGLAAVAVTADVLLRSARGEAARNDLVQVGLFVLLLAGSIFLTPYGSRLPWFLLTEATPQVPIGEWAAVALNDGSFGAFKLVLIALAAWIVAARRTSLAEAAVVVFAAVAALLHRRHIPLFAIAAAPLIAALLEDLWTRLARRIDLTPLTRAAVPALVAFALLQGAFAVAGGIQAGGTVRVDPREYPVQAMRFLAQNMIVGNVALPFRWGEYGIWALPPGSKVAVDGRFTTSYPADLLDDAWRFMAGDAGWQALLTRYPTDIVVADRRQAPSRLLRDHPDWEYVYSDPVSVVFLRKGPSQADALARFHARELQYDRRPLATEFPAAPQTAPASATVDDRWMPS